MNGTRAARIVLVAAVAAFLAAGVCHAAPDTSCVAFSGAPAGASVSLERGYRLSGVLPVTLCGVAAGTSYRLRLDGAGLERRQATFALDAGGRPSVRGIRMGTVLRNVLIPGWGSARAGRGASGAIDALSLAAAGIVLWQEQAEYGHLENRLDALTAGAAGAETYAERAAFQDAMREASRAVNVQNDHRRRLVMLGGAMYGFQIVESFLRDGPPGWIPGPERASVKLSGAERSRAKALALSIMRPGRGQLYQGKRARGAILSAGSTAAAFFALEYWNRYDQAVDRYELSVERFEASTSIPERADRAATCDLLWSAVEDSKTDRNASFAVLAGFWAFGVVDVFLGADGEPTGSPIAFELDARGPAVAIRF